MDLKRYNRHTDRPLNSAQCCIVKMTVEFLRDLPPRTNFKWVFNREYPGFPHGLETSHGLHPLPRNTENWGEEECWDLEFAVEEGAVTLAINAHDGEGSDDDDDYDANRDRATNEIYDIDEYYAADVDYDADEDCDDEARFADEASTTDGEEARATVGLKKERGWSHISNSDWLRAAFNASLHADLVVYMLNKLMDTISKYLLNPYILSFLTTCRERH